jgi:hypothetical protein
MIVISPSRPRILIRHIIGGIFVNHGEDKRIVRRLPLNPIRPRKCEHIFRSFSTIRIVPANHVPFRIYIEAIVQAGMLDKNMVTTRIKCIGDGPVKR